MGWNANNQISLIDINADPYIEEIIEIPADYDIHNVKRGASYEIVSGTVPYLDMGPYEGVYKQRPNERNVGTGNYFKAKL